MLTSKLGNHDKLATVAKALYDPLDTIASIVTEKDDLQEGAEEGRGEAKQEEAKKQAKVFLATLKPKKGAKVTDPPIPLLLFFALLLPSTPHYSFLIFLINK